MNFFPILSASFIICFFTTITAAIHDHEYLVGDVSVNCGSTENFAAVDGREWIGDGHKKISSSIQIKGSSTSSNIAGGSIFSPEQAQYKTARISRSRFSYAFHLNPGPKFIRLHFNPVPYRGFKGFKDLFTVEAGPFTLLGNFSASLTAAALGGNGKSFAKGFCINIEENQRFDIIFHPDQIIQSHDGTYAFINGIEIISIPMHLSYFRGEVQVVGLTSLAHIYNYNHTALEIIHRQNVKPSDDFANMFGVRTTIPKHKINKLNNITWKIPVDVGFRYLVRIHYCELGHKIAKDAQVISKILINEIGVESNIQLTEKRDDNEFLQYMDYMTAIQGRKQDGKHNLLISIESTDELMDRNGPLKGFEVLKLSNLDNSLASPNPQPLVRDSPYLTMQNLLKVCGDRNVIATAAITIIALVNIVAYKLHQLWENNFTEEEKMPSARARRLCRRFSLAEVEAATQNFNHAFVIGHGGFGKVYKGNIDNGQETVAIKRLKYSSNQGAREFWTEIGTLSELRHVNLVSLIGYCNEQQEMILVYEYMIHGTLGDHLFKQATVKNHSSSLSWNQCLNICIGAGRGLDYLHTGHGIIHRDVKTSNILLDENFVAKVSDFGLAKPEKICESQSHVSTNVKGTHGYFDPYYIRTRELTRKSDIYAFGVVLLEVLCRRTALDPKLEENQRSLATWALENIRKGDIEKIISSNIRGEILPDCLKAFVEVTVSCLDDEPRKRPKMAQVVLQLEYALDLQQQPNSLVSIETSITANGLQRDATLESAKPSNKNDGKSSNHANGLQRDATLESAKPSNKNDGKESKSGNHANRLQRDATLKSAKPSNKNDGNENYRQNELLNEKRDSFAEDYATEVEVTEFDLRTVVAATNGFSDSQIIGHGRGGTFYKAVLHTRQTVAVKRTKVWDSRIGSEPESYYLPKYEHPNLMKLLGNFSHGEETILVYEFMKNTTLDDILFERHYQLPWTRYFKIIVGIARGVFRLHQKKDLRIIYSDLEPCNVFLDINMNPKIAIDYCKSETNTAITTRYLPPEGYEANQRFVADIYSFGVLILEILSGRKHISSELYLGKNLIAIARLMWDRERPLDVVSTAISMGDEFSGEEAMRCIEVALLCTEFRPQDRPDMPVILAALHGYHELGYKNDGTNISNMFL